MPVIFPGSSTHDRSTNSTTTKHLLWIADALNTWGRGGSKLTAQGRKFIEDVLYPYGNKPGPLDWRYFLERKCGSGDELLQYVKDAKGLLDRMLTVAVEDQAVTRFREIAQHLHRAMRDEPVNGRMRLRWLCCDMISRLESETEDCGIGNIDPRINEAAGLAVLLEFESAPIQRTRYERDGNCTIEPFVGSTWPEPVSWISLRHGHPEFVYLFGYRLHDPAGGFPVDIPMAALVEGTDPEKRKKYDPWASNSKSEHRTTIAKLLTRWVSAIDGLPTAAPALTPNKATPETAGESVKETGGREPETGTEHEPNEPRQEEPAWQRLVLTGHIGGDDLAQLNGNEFRISSSAFTLLKLLQEKNGEMIKASTLQKDIGRRPSEIYKELPPRLQHIIDKPGKGRIGYRML